MINKLDVLGQAEITLSRFLKKVDPLSSDFKITNRGVWASECFALCVMCDLLGIETYIESGVYKGQSLLSLRAYYDEDMVIHGIDFFYYNIPHEAIVRGITISHKYTVGDSNIILPEQISKNSQFSFGVFIDGPKGWDALKLAEKIIGYDNVKFIGIHDSYLPFDTKDEHYKFRKHLENNFNTWSTDDVDFVRKYNYLDNTRWLEYLEENQLGGILPYNKIKFLHDGSKYDSRLLKSYGPTITFIWEK